jgi:hypothetical protein
VVVLVKDNFTLNFFISLQELCSLKYTIKLFWKKQTLLQRSQFQRGMDWVAFGLMRFAIWLTGHRY